MKREIIKDLLKWKESSNRKPLIVHGARQVGKTYIIKQFGKENYNNLIYVNFLHVLTSFLLLFQIAQFHFCNFFHCIHHLT